jgi:hypothetical protein
MTPTMELRFVKRRVGRNVVRILQQRFEQEGVWTAEKVWQDVPLAEDRPTPAKSLLSGD